MMIPLQLRLRPAEAADEAFVRRAAAVRARVPLEKVTEVRVVRRSLDARREKGAIMMVLGVEVYVGEKAPETPSLLRALRPASGPRVLIVGAGPAGYFAALELLELGLRPVVFERGKDVVARRYDLRKVQQEGVVPPDSNYCFGEGGAGTYSDGKLYTRAHKRGDISRVLRWLVEHGAHPDICVDAHPHIGSNKLPQIVARIRETIVAHGGEVHFDCRVTDLLLARGRVEGVRVGEVEHRGEAVILATGHSARDVFAMLERLGLPLEPKPFAMGVRIEHPQPLIDELQYRLKPRPAELPAASYRLACQVDGRGVYSFCMCPGGLIVPASTAPGEIVVNGMSLSRRDSPFANSGLVVEVHEGGLELQRQIEQAAFRAGGSHGQRAPGQRLTDFVAGKLSDSLPRCSYIPGLHPALLHEVLSPELADRLRQGLVELGRRMPGYYTEEAVLVGVESRTSSPLRVPRRPDSLAHPEVENLYPCGEGAGYAGGIVSAALDGQLVARALARVTR